MSPASQMAQAASGVRTPADIQTFVESLDAAQGLLRGAADQALSELGGGITATQLRLLDRLERLGESRLIDLADALSIAPSTATRLCDTLADRHLIVRHRRGRDRRELQIRLTDAGIRLLDAVRDRTAAKWEEALTRISADERRRATVVLKKLAEPQPPARALDGGVQPISA
ncbi:MAG: MarR family winged helix-turn-helix transcriptional regulator [Solirubrobacteraceae bacterium]